MRRAGLTHEARHHALLHVGFQYAEGGFVPLQRHLQACPVCADEAAVLMRNEGDLAGEQVVVESMEIWKVGADGLVRAIRAYFEPDAAVNDSYYVPES